MHKTDKDDTLANRSDKCSNSLVYKTVSDRQYPPLIFHELTVVSPNQQNQEMCHPKVPTELVRIDTCEGKCDPHATSKENAIGVSRPRGKPKIRNSQIDRKRPSRFQPILPRTVLQNNIHNCQHVKSSITQGNETKRLKTAPTVSADMMPLSANIQNDHNVNFYLVKNSTAVVNDSPISNAVVCSNAEMLPKPADQQVILFTKIDQFGSAEIKITGASSNINCLTGNPFYYYNTSGDQSNVHLSLKGRETIDSAIQRCKRAESRNINIAGPLDILQAADKLNVRREVRNDPSSVEEDCRKNDEPCDNRKSCILDVAEENGAKNFKPDLVQCEVSSKNDDIESSDDSKATVESRVSEDLTLRRLIRPEQTMRPKLKCIESLSPDDSDEDCVDLTDLIRTSAEQAESFIKWCADGDAKRRAADAKTAEILRRFPPTFMQDLFEDVSNSNPGSYVDAYATAMAINDDDSSLSQ